MTAENVEDRLASSIQQAVTAANNPQTVPVNMYEADEAYVMVAPLTGATEDDVTIKVEGNRLHLYAEMRTPAIKAYLMHEWNYGPYERSIDIPDDCTGKYDITVGNGQLVVRLFRR
jgi:HSP20 family molecular chaperone IbpA